MYVCVPIYIIHTWYLSFWFGEIIMLVLAFSLPFTHAKFRKFYKISLYQANIFPLICVCHFHLKHQFLKNAYIMAIFNNLTNQCKVILEMINILGHPKVREKHKFNNLKRIDDSSVLFSQKSTERNEFRLIMKILMPEQLYLKPTTEALVASVVCTALFATELGLQIVNVTSALIRMVVRRGTTICTA